MGQKFILPAVPGHTINQNLNPLSPLQAIDISNGTPFDLDISGFGTPTMTVLPAGLMNRYYAKVNNTGSVQIIPVNNNNVTGTGVINVTTYYTTEEIPPGTFPCTVPVQVVQAKVSTITNLVNDGNAAGTNIIEATVLGDGASAVTLTNDANFVLGDVAHPGSLIVAGGSTFNGAVSITAGGTGLAVTNNETIGGTLGVTGASALHALTATTAGFSGAVTATAAGTGLAVTNNATIGGTLGVTGAATIGGTLNLTVGPLQIAGNTLLSAGANTHLAPPPSGQIIFDLTGLPAMAVIDANGLTVNDNGSVNVGIANPSGVDNVNVNGSVRINGFLSMFNTGAIVRPFATIAAATNDATIYTNTDHGILHISNSAQTLDIATFEDLNQLLRVLGRLAIDGSGAPVNGSVGGSIVPTFPIWGTGFKVGIITFGNYNSVNIPVINFPSTIGRGIFIVGDFNVSSTPTFTFFIGGTPVSSHLITTLGNASTEGTPVGSTTIRGNSLGAIVSSCDNIQVSSTAGIVINSAILFAGA